MAVITLSVTATSSAGASGSATVDVILAEPPSVSVVVNPQSAPANTLRTATITVVDPNGSDWTASAFRSDSGPVTQISSNEFQFTY